MKQNELILEYLDGALDPAAEQDLFEALAGHPELRATLRGFVQIGDAVRGDREAFTPPAAVEASLMRRLGFAAMAGSAPRAGWLAGIFRNRAFGLFAAFILGALLTAALFRVTDDGEALTGAKIASIGSSSASPRSRNAPIPPEYSGAAPNDKGLHPMSTPQVPMQSTDRPALVQRSAPGSVSRRSITPPTREITPDRSSGAAASSSTSAATHLDRYAPLPSQSAAPSTKDRSEIIEPVREIDLAMMRQEDSYPITYLSINRDPLLPYRRIGTDNALVVDLSTSREAGRGEWVFEIRHGLTSTDLADVSALTPAMSFTEDGAIGVYRHLTPDIALGIEGGRERYAQRIPYVTGDTIAIEQRPVYTWGGGALRYYPGAVLGFDPLLQGGLGFSAAGPIGRGRLGLERDVVSRLRLCAGLETSALFYTADDRRQISQRWGLFGGLGIALP